MAVRANALRVQLLTRPDCPLCDGMADKLAALVSKANFEAGLWTNAEVQVCCCYTESRRASIIVLAAFVAIAAH